MMQPSAKLGVSACVVKFPDIVAAGRRSIVKAGRGAAMYCANAPFCGRSGLLPKAHRLARQPGQTAFLDYSDCQRL
jgi:hypothetical protein